MTWETFLPFNDYICKPNGQTFFIFSFKVLSPGPNSNFYKFDLPINISESAKPVTIKCDLTLDFKFSSAHHMQLTLSIIYFLSSATKFLIL